jgi:hypothetical protein
MKYTKVISIKYSNLYLFVAVLCVKSFFLCTPSTFNLYMLFSQIFIQSIQLVSTIETILNCLCFLLFTWLEPCNCILVQIQLPYDHDQDHDGPVYVWYKSSSVIQIFFFFFFFFFYKSLLYFQLLFLRSMDMVSELMNIVRH